MKDLHGVQRGKCNSCDCQEYIAPSISGKLRCEYCNHTPGEHVKSSTTKLGKCNKCSDCMQYESEDPSCSADCDYCGCTARDHGGTQRTHAGLPQAHFSIQTSPRSSQPRTAGSYQGTSDHEHQFHPCEEPQSKIHAKPTQTAFYGNCIYPGCPFPKYVDVEEGKVHDFCSKSCATNFAQMQAAFHQQKVNQQGHDGLYRTSTGGLPLLVSKPIRPPGGSQPHPSMQGGIAGVKVCSKCGKNPANPGRGWCQQCFVSSKS